MMSVITDMIVSAILKRGIMMDVKAFETDVDIPTEDPRRKIIVKIKAENMQVRMMNSEDKKE